MARSGVAGASLRVVVSSLGPHVLRVVDPGGGLDREAVEAQLYEPGAPVAAGALVLAVGVTAGSDAYVRALDEAAAGGAVAVAVKAGPEALLEALLHRQAADRPAVLAVEPGLSWDHLYALLRSALSITGTRLSSPQDRAPRAVPLGDLYALANATAAAVGGAVAIEDMRLRVLAYSSLDGQPIDETRRLGILDQRVPTRAANDELYRRLFRLGTVLRDHAASELPRVAVPIGIAGENLGSIWVVGADEELSADTEAILLDVARIAALHLLHARATENLERELRADLLSGLFDGRLAAAHVATRLGLATDVGYAVVALQPLHPGPAPTGDDAAERAHALSRLADLVSLRLEAQRSRATAVLLGSVVYALVPLEVRRGAPVGGADTATLRVLVEQIVSDARQALRLPVRGAIGPAVTSLADAARSRREADLVLTVLDPRAGDPPVATAEALRNRVVLAELSALTENHPWLFTGAAQEIAAYDAVKHTQYGATLRAFLDRFGDSAAAADLVGVHPNTLRYRLRRIREVFGVDLDDADTRLVLALQARLRADRPAGSRDALGR